MVNMFELLNTGTPRFNHPAQSFYHKVQMENQFIELLVGRIQSVIHLKEIQLLISKIGNVTVLHIFLR